MGKVIQFPTAAAADPKEEVNFGTFARTLMVGDVASATEALQTILAVSADVATAACAHFQQAMQSDPMFMKKAQSLKMALESGGTNDALAVIYDCFGISGPEAVKIHKHLCDTLLTP